MEESTITKRDQSKCNIYNNNEEIMRNPDKNRVYKSNSLNNISNSNIKNESHILQLKRDKKKLKNKLLNHNHNSDHSNHSNPRSKQISSTNTINKLNFLSDINTSNSIILDYGDVSQTKRNMKQYKKRVEIFTNRINALKKQETELSNKMAVMIRKEKTIEEIKKSKMKLKEFLNQSKKDMQIEKQTKKEQVMMQKLEELEKIEKIKREMKEKNKQSNEVCRTHQSLMRSMTSQSNTRVETLNKYKCLQVKEGYAMYYTEEYNKIKEKEEMRKSSLLRKITEDNEVIQSLKDQCSDLEKMEEKCFEKLKTTKIQSRHFQFKADPCFVLNNKNAIVVNHANNNKTNQEKDINADHNIIQDENKVDITIGPKEKMISKNDVITQINTINQSLKLKKEKTKTKIIHQNKAASNKLTKAHTHLIKQKTTSFIPQNKTKRNSTDNKTAFKTIDHFHPLSQSKNDIKKVKCNSGRQSNNTSSIANQRKKSCTATTTTSTSATAFPLSSKDLKYSTLV